MSRIEKTLCTKCGYSELGEPGFTICPNCDGVRMTQERTERFTRQEFQKALENTPFEPDLERAAKIVRGTSKFPHMFECWVDGGNNCPQDLIDITKYVGQEIDRLNATIAGYRRTADQDDREIKRLTDLVDKQVEIISGHNDGMSLAKYLHDKDQKKIADLTANVQERDAMIREWQGSYDAAVDAGKAKIAERDKTIEGRGNEIIRLRDNQDFLVRQVEQRDKEIERLRANLAYAHEALGEAYDVAPDDSAVEGILFLAYNEVGAALKGAE